MKRLRVPKSRRGATVALLGACIALTSVGAVFAAQPDGVGVPPQANVETITVCHVPPTDGVPSEILTIPLAALGGHLGHGDFILTAGLTCPATPPPPPVDVCPEIDGVQTDPNACPPPAPVDVCPNIDGNQETIPAGLVLLNGACVTPAPPGSGDTPGTPDNPVEPENPGPSLGEDTPDTATGGATSDPTTAPTATAGAAATGQLPFTGIGTTLPTILGLVLVMLGTALHTSARRRERLATERS